MLGRLLRSRGHAVIAVVRRASQVELLVNDGAEHVLDSTAKDFVVELRELTAKLRADARARRRWWRDDGPDLLRDAARLVVLVYGMLSNAAVRSGSLELVFPRKSLEGFTMYEWLRTTSTLGQLFALMKVQGLLSNVLRTNVKARFGLDAHEAALAAAMGSASDGKILLAP